MFTYPVIGAAFVRRVVQRSDEKQFTGPEILVVLVTYALLDDRALPGARRHRRCAGRRELGELGRRFERGETDRRRRVVEWTEKALILKAEGREGLRR